MTPRSKRVLDAFCGSVWAILPEKLDAICAVIEMRANGGTLTKREIRAAIGSRRNGAMDEQRGGVLVLPIVGTITQRAGLMSEWSGGVSAEKLGAQFDKAMDSADIGTIVFDVDSPGGEVSGIPELAAKIYEARGKKKVIAVANSLMASAAYYIASAADEVVVTPSGLIGSIGVLHVHAEYSEALDDAGIKVTITRAGKRKAEVNSYEPLTDGAAARMQEMIDDYYEQFVAAVAEHRGTSPEAVRVGYGQGGVLTAARAVSAGLADRVATLEQVLAELGVERGQLASARISASAEAEKLPDDVNVSVALYDLPATYVHTAAGTGNISVVSAHAGPAVPAVVLPVANDEPEDDAEDEPEDDDMAEVDGATPSSASTPEPHAAPRAEGDDAMSATPDTAAPDGAGIQTREIDAAIAAERQRTQGISALAAEHGMQDKAAAWIESGKSVNDVGMEILRAGARKPSSKPVGSFDVDIPKKERREFSLNRLILAMADNDFTRAGYEREVSEATVLALAKADTQYAPQGGMFLPTTLAMPLRRGLAWDGSPMPRAALETGGSDAGEDLVFTERGSFIELLRNRLVTTQMGARFLTGLVGNVSFPKQTGAGDWTWVEENPASGVSDSDLTTGSVSLTPKEGNSSTAFSRRLLVQSTPDAEGLVRQDLMAITVRGIDLAALHGTGANNQPTGIYTATDVNPVAFGGTVSFAKVVEMETAIVADNADIGVMGYVTTPEIRGAAKTTQVFSGSNGMPIWTGSVLEGEMNGYRSMASNQLSKTLESSASKHGMIFGVWSELMIGEWGAVEITVDPYSQKKKNLIEVTIHAIVDVALRHGQAFSKATGLTLT